MLRLDYSISLVNRVRFPSRILHLALLYDPSTYHAWNTVILEYATYTRTLRSSFPYQRHQHFIAHSSIVTIFPFQSCFRCLASAVLLYSCTLSYPSSNFAHAFSLFLCLLRIRDFYYSCLFSGVFFYPPFLFVMFLSRSPHDFLRSPSPYLSPSTR